MSMLRVSPIELQELQQLIGVYADPNDNLTARARMRAIYRAGQILDHLNTNLKASKKRLAELVEMKGIDEEFIRQLLIMVRDLHEEDFLDKVSTSQVTTVDGLYKREYLAAYKGTPDGRGRGSYDIVISELRKLSKGLGRLSTYERTMEQLRQIHRFFLGVLPAVAQESITRDPWFFSMQPCVCCGEYPNIAISPTGYELEAVKIRLDEYIIPKCDDCRDRGAKVNEKKVMQLYVRYATMLEQEIMNKEVEHFGNIIDITEEEEGLFGKVLW